MNPIPRRIGWLLMLVALAVALAARMATATHFGPFPVAAIAILVGGIGMMLVLTDRMVRALYAQVDSVARSEPAAAGDATVGGDGDDVAVGGDLDRA